MLVITDGYTIYNEWEDISIHKAIKVNGLVMPDFLVRLCKALNEGKEDKYNEIQKGITEDDIKALEIYYKDVAYHLSNIPREKIDAVKMDNMISIGVEYLFNIVYGLKYNDFSNVSDATNFWYANNTYEFPVIKDVLGSPVPMYGVTTLELTEASDIDTVGRKNNHWEYTSLIIAYLCRPDGESLDIEKVKERAEWFNNLPVSIAWSVYYRLYGAHEHIRKLYPKMFNKSKSKTPVMASEVDKMGWRSSVLNMAKNGYFNKAGLTSIESVEQSNFWDFLEVLNFERINK